MSSFPKNVIELSPWSMSKVQAAVNCPFRFRVKYVERKKGHEPKRSAGRVGIAAHAAIEKYLLNVDLKRALHEAAIDNKLTTPEIEELVSYTQHILSFVQRLDTFKKAKNVSEQFVEKRFGLTVDNRPTKFFPKKGRDEPVFFRGVWDICLRAREKYIIIIDHKSGAVKEIDTYRDQLRLYAIAAVHVFPNVAGVQSALHFLQSEEIVWDKLELTEKIKAEYFPWYVDFLSRAAQEAANTHARKGWYCGFCEYTDLCPLKE